ncbi:hypothetical protein ACJX0J_005722, partial [Zea mays]
IQGAAKSNELPQSWNNDRLIGYFVWILRDLKTLTPAGCDSLMFFALFFLGQPTCAGQDHSFLHSIHGFKNVCILLQLEAISMRALHKSTMALSSDVFIIVPGLDKHANVYVSHKIKSKPVIGRMLYIFYHQLKKILRRDINGKKGIKGDLEVFVVVTAVHYSATFFDLYIIVLPYHVVLMDIGSFDLSEKGRLYLPVYQNFTQLQKTILLHTNTSTSTLITSAIRLNRDVTEKKKHILQ